MPGQNGLDVLTEIKKMFPDLPVVMLSALNEEDTAREAIRRGAYDYITKPIELKKLKEEIVDRLLE